MKEERIKEIEDFFKVMKEQEWFKDLKKLMDEMYEALEYFNKPKLIPYITEVKDNTVFDKNICEHVWVLDNSSTCGNTFRCIKCPAVKHDPVYDPNWFWYEHSYSTYMLGC